MAIYAAADEIQAVVSTRRTGGLSEQIISRASLSKCLQNRFVNRDLQVRFYGPGAAALLSCRKERQKECLPGGVVERYSRT